MLDELFEGSGELALAVVLHGLCKDHIRIVVVKTRTYMVPRLLVCRKQLVWLLKSRLEMDIVLANTLWVQTLA